MSCNAQLHIEYLRKEWQFWPTWANCMTYIDADPEQKQTFETGKRESEPHLQIHRDSEILGYSISRNNPRAGEYPSHHFSADQEIRESTEVSECCPHLFKSVE